MVVELTIRLTIKFTNELKIEFCSKKKDKKGKMCRYNLEKLNENLAYLHFPMFDCYILKLSSI